MSGPAQNGVLIYSSNIDSLSEFYLRLFNMRLLRRTNDFISMERDGFNLIIHVPPFNMPNETFSPIKLFLSVQDLEKARKDVIELGGKTFEGEWANPIFRVSNVADRDGNHIQLREFHNQNLSK